MSDLAEFHDELRAVARTILATATPTGHHGDPPPPLDWSLLVDAGWLGLEVPETCDGAGAAFAETAVVLEELGRAAATSGFVGTAVLGVAALNCAEPHAARDALLGSVATGAVKLAVTIDAAPGRPSDVTAPFQLVDGRLTGSCGFVLDAPDADTLLLLATSEGNEPVLVAVDATHRDVVVEPIDVVDGTRRFATVRVERMRISPADTLRFTDSTALQRLSDRAALATACDSLGVAGAMLAATVSYVGQRVQFDRPIGSFQAVKHACADMLVQVTIGRELLDAAIAATVAADARAGGTATVEVAMASSYLGSAAVDVAGSAMQLHGGIGYTWESGVHVYLKRAVLDRQLFGTPIAHRRTLAARYSG